MNKIKQPWIYSSMTDILFILSPAFISLIVVFIFSDQLQNTQESLFTWVLLVLLIDVAHVYSTLYRTYFDKETYTQHKNVLVYIPLLAWVLGVIVYEIDALLFWRLLAYMAVFHFIRQQYGFMRIYSRKDNLKKIYSIIDTIAIYSATIYPILYWHTHAPRNFHWFIDGDFYYFKSKEIAFVSFLLYVISIAIYFIKELSLIIINKTFNLPKNLIIIGTFLSWYFGIVYYNGDLIFTLLNVVSHGIPYMALVWIYGRKKYQSSDVKHEKKMRFLFSGYGILFFLLIIFLFAYLEEGVWDGLVWRDHTAVFPLFSALPVITSKDLLSFIVPLLSLPQISHYLIDGFIWKISRDKYNWRKVTLE